MNTCECGMPLFFLYLRAGAGRRGLVKIGVGCMSGHGALTPFGTIVIRGTCPRCGEGVNVPNDVPFCGACDEPVELPNKRAIIYRLGNYQTRWGWLHADGTIEYEQSI